MMQQQTLYRQQQHQAQEELIRLPIWPHSIDILRRRHHRRLPHEEERQEVGERGRRDDGVLGNQHSRRKTKSDSGTKRSRGLVEEDTSNGTLTTTNMRYLLEDDTDEQQQEDDEDTTWDGTVMDDWLIDALYLGLGTHYVDLWVGCPIPQRQTVIVDTGSHLTAFPCLGCGSPEDKYCGTMGTNHIDTAYRQNESTCFHPLYCPNDCMAGECSRRNNEKNDDTTDTTEIKPPNQRLDDTTTSTASSSLCAVSSYYMEGSGWEAFECVDQVYSGGYHNQIDVQSFHRASINLTFGCQTAVSGLFKTQLADGIAGMTAVPTSYWAQHYKAGVITRAQFSLCFSKPTTPLSRSGTRAGIMVLGGTDIRLHQTPMVYANLIVRSSDGAYLVTLEKIYLRVGDGESIVSSNTSSSLSTLNVPWTAIDMPMDVVNQNDAIVDSGTTNTFLYESLYESFNTVWKNLTGTNYDNEVHPYTSEDIQSLPTIIFQFKPWKENSSNNSMMVQPGITGHELDPDHPHSIVVTFPPSHYLRVVHGGSYMSRLVFNRQNGATQTLGANFMTGKDMLFDIDKGRLGFAESDCDYVALHQNNSNDNSNHSSTNINEENNTNSMDGHGAHEISSTSSSQTRTTSSPTTQFTLPPVSLSTLVDPSMSNDNPVSTNCQEKNPMTMLCRFQTHPYWIIALSVLTILLFILHQRRTRRTTTRQIIPLDDFMDDSLPYHDDEMDEDYHYEMEMIHSSKTTT